MANFKMHLTGAAVGGGVFASFCLGTGLAQPADLTVLVAMSTIGGILPDIDLDHSSPTTLLFTSLGVLCAFAVFIGKSDTYSLLELWIIAGLSYALVRFPIREAFSRFTVHRGIYHSLAAAFTFWFFTTALSYQAFDFSSELAWVLGMAVFFGYLIHLVLDEIYSVDFLNKRIKASFGTALKIVHHKDLPSSALMVGAMVLAFVMTPDSNDFTSKLFDLAIWGRLLDNTWPTGMWFDF